MESSLKRQLHQTVQQCVKKSKLELGLPAQKFAVPEGFKEFNETIGLPIHPGTGKETEVFDYQEDYFNAWQKHHKLILNKSRKIGATETALRIIAYNCLRGNYSGHRVMIVAGNKQEVANRFIQRFKSLFYKGFTDLDGRQYKYEDIVLEETSKSCTVNNTYIQAYPAGEAVRGEENVKCVFMSECAFINLIDDSKVYNALHPNVANIKTADFVMESTPNGKRGFFWANYDANSEYHKLEQDYTVSLGKLLDDDFIKAEKKNPRIDFLQEYGCRFTTSLSAAFKEDEIIFEEKQINMYEDL
jgi:hypothetical protein